MDIGHIMSNDREQGQYKSLPFVWLGQSVQFVSDFYDNKALRYYK